MTKGMSSEEISRRRKTRMILVVMVILFSAPYIASFILYKYGDKFNLGSTNYGQLLGPRIPFQSVGFETLDGKKVDVDAYRGEWLILAIGSSKCDDTCKANMFKMRQIRKLMGVDRAWIRRAYALTDAEDMEGLRDFMRDYEGTDLLRVTEQTRVNLVNQLKIDKNSLEGRMLFVDPAGDIILLYPPNPDPKGVYGDLKKVYDVYKRATAQG